MSLPLLATEKLGVTLGSRAFCRELDLVITAGKLVAVLGPNGAGKTLLLHTLAGLRPPSSGKVLLEGRPYSTWSGDAAARCRGLLTQQQSDYFDATVLETALIGRHPHLGRWQWEGTQDLKITRAALLTTGLEGLEARSILNLSGGERQRVALAALLAQQPRLFLLDEPLNHLDLHYQIAMLGLFRKLAAEGRGVVLVLHDINLAARYADEVILLDGRGGVNFGPAAEILANGSLSHAFGHPLRSFQVDGRTYFLPESADYCPPGITLGAPPS